MEEPDPRRLIKALSECFTRCARLGANNGDREPVPGYVEFALVEEDEGQPVGTAGPFGGRLKGGLQVVGRGAADDNREDAVGRGLVLHQLLTLSGGPPALTRCSSPVIVRHTAPDSVPDVVRESVLKAVSANFTILAHAGCGGGRSALLREKDIRIGLRAECTVEPSEFAFLISEAPEAVKQRRGAGGKGRNGRPPVLWAPGRRLAAGQIPHLIEPP